MEKLQISSTLLKYPGQEVYIIAEIGQNHQGSLETAKLMIFEAKRAGCNCVKFQKSCLEEKFTEAALSRPYISKNSWGRTYGEHKEYLEFTIDEMKELQKYAESLNIDFAASCMDEVSLKQLAALNVPFIKIGSGDTNNYPLISAAAKFLHPLIISTGMQSNKTIEKVVSIMKEANKNDYALLHCVSSYPTKYEDCNLMMIPKLIETYPNVCIGYSGHECGIEVSLAAVLLGARIIERHFTLNKNEKGSDHLCSLEPLELTDLVCKIRKMENFGVLKRNFTKEQLLLYFNHKSELSKALGLECEKTILPCEMSCREKLGKSLVARENLYRGHLITPEDLKIKVSEPNGIPAEEYYNILGKEVKQNISKDHPINYNALL